jgi:hypothetical protein
MKNFLLIICFFCSAIALAISTNSLFAQETEGTETETLDLTAPEGEAIIDFSVFNFDFSKNERNPVLRVNGGNFANFTYEKSNQSIDFNQPYSVSVELGINSTNLFKRNRNFSNPPTMKDDEDFYNSPEIKYINDHLSRIGMKGISFNYKNGNGNFLEPKFNPDYLNLTENISAFYNFNFLSYSGYSYDFGENLSLRLLNSSNMSWSYLEFQDIYFPFAVPIETASQDFGNDFRFGMKYSSEANLRILKPLSLTFTGDRTVVFPRTIFWEWAGSWMILNITESLLDRLFIRKIQESSPFATPIVNFVLHSALQFGFSELQKRNMNWPFNSANPLIIDDIRIGLQFEF